MGLYDRVLKKDEKIIIKQISEFLSEKGIMFHREGEQGRSK